MTQHVRKLLGLGLIVGFAATGLIATPGVDAAPAAPVAVASKWSAPGPWAVTVAPGGSAHTLYYPTNLGQGGVRHPVIIWGNGTGASVSQYDFALRHLASWGFVVAAANTGQSGSGQEMLAGANFLIAENGRAGSVFFGKVDVDHIGASGHSQGGGGAIAAAADPRIDAVVPVQPGPQGQVGSIRGPAFYIAGQFDWIVPAWFVRARYSGTTQVPAVYGTLRGADHFITEPYRPALLAAVTAWFRFWLFADESARADFFGPATTCGLCTDSAWTGVQRNARAQAIPG